MPIGSYQIRICPSCGLRYPLVTGHPYGTRCPACLGSTMILLTQTIEDESGQPAGRAALHIEALLDNVRSAWNVGSMIRTAEGFGVHEIHLCGITPTPENGSVRRTALGAEQLIPCTYHKDAVSTASSMKADGFQLWGLETAGRAIPVNAIPLVKRSEAGNIVLAVGNEVTGVDPGLLDLCDELIQIPMRGGKRSFNVAVAFGIALGYLLLE